MLKYSKKNNALNKISSIRNRRVFTKKRAVTRGGGLFGRGKPKTNKVANRGNELVKRVTAYKEHIYKFVAPNGNAFRPDHDRSVSRANAHFKSAGEAKIKQYEKAKAKLEATKAKHTELHTTMPFTGKTGAFSRLFLGSVEQQK
uniref:Uncharacterized protein n=1 Tax=viral metagenome TaxID=1070528 RepID=A0A6C0HLG9_9ZZZZ